MPGGAPDQSTDLRRLADLAEAWDANVGHKTRGEIVAALRASADAIERLREANRVLKEERSRLLGIMRDVRAYTMQRALEGERGE